jgi:hypothetical protein
MVVALWFYHNKMITWYYIQFHITVALDPLPNILTIVMVRYVQELLIYWKYADSTGKGSYMPPSC